ncbi:MAG: hypothetical protein ACJ0BW_03975 [Pontiellaceae bacterium]
MHKYLNNLKWVARFFIISIFLLNDSEARVFTLMDGTTVEGQIQDYDLRSEKAIIRTKLRRKSIKADDLDNESYKYVINWDAARQFGNPDKFRITMYGPEKISSWLNDIWLRNPGKVQPWKTHEISLSRMGYDLKLINDTGHDLENIKVKYCLFYKQDRMDHSLEERVTDVVVRSCLEKYSIFPNESTDRRALKSIVLRDVEIIYVKTSGLYWTEVKEYLEGDGRFLRSDFIGAILRVEMEDPDGNIVSHENRYPKDLPSTYEWVEPTESNAYWDDDYIEDITDTYKPPTPFEEMGGVEEEEE